MPLLYLDPMPRPPKKPPATPRQLVARIDCRDGRKPSERLGGALVLGAKLAEKHRARDEAERARRVESPWEAKNSINHANATARKFRSDAEVLTLVDWHRVLTHYGDKCIKCGCPDYVTIDHVVPLSVGGRNHYTNLQPLCTGCNSQKSDLVEDYRPDFGRKLNFLEKGKA